MTAAPRPHPFLALSPSLSLSLSPLAASRARVKVLSKQLTELDASLPKLEMEIRAKGEEAAVLEKRLQGLQQQVWYLMVVMLPSILLLC
jgi:septal ring factor EnvC (AmiA/AmiB activator)